MSEGGDEASTYNLSRIFSVGLLFNKAQQLNEIAGAYTTNTLRQKKINTGMTFAKYGIGIAINPAVGLAYAGGDLLYRQIQYNVATQKQNRQADYYNRISGNAQFSGRKYRGNFI